MSGESGTVAPLYASVVDSITSFEAHQPQECFWCDNACVVLGIDPLVMLACQHSEHVKFDKSRKQKLPPNWDYRPFLKMVDPFEVCEHWKPTKVGSYRMKVMQACGMFDESADAKLARMREERKAKKRERKSRKSTATAAESKE